MTREQTRGEMLDETLRRPEKIHPGGEQAFWESLCGRIDDRQVIPVISNSLWYDHIFQLDDPAAPAGGDGKVLNPCSGILVKWSVENQLSQIWAERIGYPLPDCHELARVAQYFASRPDEVGSFQAGDDYEAKNGFISFLRWALTDMLEKQGVPVSRLREKRATTMRSSRPLSDLVWELDLPAFPPDRKDPLSILAELPLPIYLTTSYHDFLERALIRAGRHPVRQVCFWSGKVAQNEAEGEKLPDDYVPSETQPLVYHIFGDERYPTTMVLTEDDYLNFLVRVTQPIDKFDPLLPSYLLGPLQVSSLILLGYRLQDWDFRVLFRGIINMRHQSEQNLLRMLSLIIQLTPDQQYTVRNVNDACRYLEHYFGQFMPSRFMVKWGGTEHFLNDLWDEWNTWRR